MEKYSLRFRVCNWIFKGELRKRLFIMKFILNLHCRFIFKDSSYLVNDVIKCGWHIKFITKRFPIKFKICDFIYSGTLSYALPWMKQRLKEIYEHYRVFGFDDYCREKCTAIIELINQLQFN